jgi:RHS repeat-associated protein
MAGISSKAFKTNYAENKRRFNKGNELQSNEFSDGSGLEIYDATFRLYDAQIGRFHQIDPLADLSLDLSPFAFSNNNPILLNDPLGLKGDTAWKSLPEIVITAKKKTSDFVNWFSGANIGYKGSGWGHGPRRWLANQLGLGNQANNLIELVLHSQLQSRQVNLTGRLLDQIKTDPEMLRHQNEIIKIFKADPRFKKLTFKTKGSIKNGVGFGGKRWESSNENWGAMN